MGIQFKKKYTSSQVWKGVLWGLELLSKGMNWEVRNGMSVAFWQDRWLENQPIWELALQPVSGEEMEFKVCLG